MSKTYKFKFSIIMSIYKTDKWLREAVDSIINQDIGFEENVQIIMVNDGSPDNSEEICLEYQKQYPNNIVYKKKKNGGLSSARNYGLRYREGEYVNFFDPDDILSKNTLREVNNFLNKNKDSIDLVAIPLIFFEARNGLHPKYKYFGEKNRVIDLQSEPHNFILSSASAFYKTALFNKRKFDENILGEEDTIVNFSIFDENDKFGYVCERGVTYWYRRRIDGSSNVNSNEVNPEAYLAPIHLFETITNRLKKTDLYKQLIIYELRSRLAGIRQDFFNTKEEFDDVIAKYVSYIKKVDLNNIIESPLLSNEKDRFLLARLRDPIAEIKYNNTGAIYLGEHNLKWKPGIFLKKVDFIDNTIQLDVLSYNFKDENLRVSLYTQKRDEVTPVFINSAETPQSIKRGEFLLSETQHYRYVLPIDKNAEYRFLLMKDRDIVSNNPKVSKFKMSKFALNSKRIRIWYEGAYISAFDNKLVIQKDEKQHLFRDGIKAFRVIFKKYHKLPVGRLLARTNKKYLLLADRPMIGGDNAEALFRYIRENENDLKKNTYYVLDKRSVDYKRLKSIGNVIPKGSVRHWYIYLNSKLLLSSHLAHEFIAPFRAWKYKFYADLIDRRFVWLQHGVTYNNVAGAATKFHKGIDAVITAASTEVKEFSQPAYSYDSDDIIQSGFSRFDLLSDASSKQNSKIVTIMPTWRSYLSSEILESGLHKKIDGFTNTDYFLAYSNILTDKRLLESFAKNNIKLQFVLHPGVLQFIDAFKEYENKNISILNPNQIDYKTIFSNSSLLITDYSSVFFDFSYLYKPVLFYQFDQEKFFTKHYKRSEYFGYDKNGVGEVIRDHDVLVDAIIASIDSNFTLSNKYKSRIDKLFIHHDKSNCKRIVDELRKKKYV